MHDLTSQSHLGEGLLDVSDEVLLVLDTNGDTDEVVLDSEKLSVGLGNGAVGHESGVLGERLDTSKTLSQSENLKVSEESIGVLNTALHVERDHGTGSAGLLTGNSVLGMALKTGVGNALNLRVGLEALGDSHSVAHSFSDAHFEGLAGAHGQPRVEGIKASAHSLKYEVDFVVELAGVHHHGSGNKVGVATDVLGDGVSDDISTEKERVLVDGGHESVVNNEQSTVGLAALGEGLNIEDLKGRVGGSLEPDHSSVLAQLRLEFLGIREVLEGDLDVGVRSKDLTEVSLGAAIDVIDNEDVISLLAKVHEGNVSSHS